MKEFLEFLITQIISKPEEFKIEEVIEGNEYTYHITVAQEDMGAVIGKEGKTIKSIRELAITKAIKDKIKVNVHLVEIEQQL